MNNLAQIRDLNVRGTMHVELGNTLLASWMLESAKHIEKIYVETQRVLDSMPLGNYEDEDTRIVGREDFRSQWYDYEEEYNVNFSMD